MLCAGGRRSTSWNAVMLVSTRLPNRRKSEIAASFRCRDTPGCRRTHSSVLLTTIVAPTLAVKNGSEARASTDASARAELAPRRRVADGEREVAGEMSHACFGPHGVGTEDQLGVS